MKTEKLKALYEKYELSKDDVFKHQHYIIITRSGIAEVGDNSIQTFGSALKGTNHRDGNCNTWYVMEMAEKRAMSRAVLKLTGFYELGVFGEDESEDFKRKDAAWKSQ